MSTVTVVDSELVPLRPGSVDGLRVRMSIHTGVAVERDGDYFGPALNRAARLLATAHGGQIVLSGIDAGAKLAIPVDGAKLHDGEKVRLAKS